MVARRIRIRRRKQGGSTAEADPLLKRVAVTMDLHGVCQSTMVQLTSGAFLTGFLLALGAGEVMIGIAAAFPLFMKLSQLYTSWRIERSGRWRRIALQGASLGRLPLYLAAALPFLPLAPGIEAWLLVTIIAITSLGGAVWEIAFLTWMAELIPQRVRGGFWGKRTRIAEINGLAVALLAAWLFDRWQDANPGSLGGFAAVFGIAAVAGTFGIFFLTKVPLPEHPVQRAEPASLLATLRRPARDENYRTLLYFVAIWGVSVGLMGPFTSVYMLQELHLGFLPVTIVSVLPSAVIAFTQAYWGRLGDHFGSKPVLWIATHIIILSTLLWLVSGPERTWPLYLLQVVSGVGWSAYNISINNLVLKLAPPASRSSYVATLGAVSSLAQAAAPVLGGILLTSMQSGGIDSIHSYYILFAFSAVLRIIATPILGYVEEKGGAQVGHLIRVMGRFRSMGSAPGTDLLFDYTYTHMARVADFIIRERQGKRLPGFRRRRAPG